MSTIVLAYSGGLDTSVLLKQFVLAGHRTIALTADLGESDALEPRGAGAGASPALDEVRRKALALGASDALLIDARERFVERVRATGACAQTRCTRASIRCPPRSRGR